MDHFRVPLCFCFKASLSAKQETHSLLCETILMKMSLIYMKIKLHAELIFV